MVYAFALVLLGTVGYPLSIIGGVWIVTRGRIETPQSQSELGVILGVIVYGIIMFVICNTWNPFS